MSVSAKDLRLEDRSIKRALGLGSALFLLLGIWWAAAPEELLAYLIVTVASLIPAIAWVRQGRLGVPILPAVAFLHILYYAIPIVRGREDLETYSYGDILQGAVTVGLYLMAATFAASFLMRGARRGGSQTGNLLSDAQMKTLIYLGLAVGNFFLIAASAGKLGWMGGFFGLARSIALTSLLVACYFLGVGRGRAELRGSSWWVALAGLGLAIVVSWSSLYLIGGLMFLLATAVGYVTTRGRIPWLTVGLAIVLISILHAGKEAMRNRYWQQDGGEQTSLVRLPQLAVEWFRSGLESLGTPTKGRSAIDRASLMQILLKVQYLTPAYIDYLRGETYALLPAMLVPRFVDPEKLKSQAGMDLLNIRYGILSAEGVEKTAVGWGLIAESYANFGLLGVIGIGLVIGAASGALGQWSARGSAVSVSTLVSVAMMVGLINLEQDFAGLVTSLLQSIAAIFVFVAVLRLFPKRRRRGQAHIRAAGLAEPRPRDAAGTSELQLRL